MGKRLSVASHRAPVDEELRLLDQHKEKHEG